MMRATLTRGVAIGALGVLAMLAGGCDRAKPAPAVAPPVTIRSEVVKELDVPIVDVWPGITQAVRMVELDARVEGWLLKYAAQDGSVVKSGSLIYQIDPAPFEAKLQAANASVAKAQAQVAYANDVVDRNQPLAQSGALAPQTFDQYIMQQKEAAAQLQQALADQVLATLNLGYCSVMTPMDGQLGPTQVYEGQLVGPNMNRKLNSVMQLDPLWVAFNPPALQLPAYAARLAAGGVNATVVFPTGRGASVSRSGKLVFIDNTTGATTSTVMMRIEIPNTDHSILPGTYGSVQVDLGTLPKQITISRDALFVQIDKTKVWVVTGDVAQPVPVVLGRPVGDRISVVSGLKSGDRVVTQGGLRLKPGSKVVEAPPDESATPAGGAALGTTPGAGADTSRAGSAK